MFKGHTVLVARDHAAFINLRRCSNNVSRKRLCQPVSTLRPTRKDSKMIAPRRMQGSVSTIPDNLTAISTPNTAKLIERFMKDESVLVKFCAVTGFIKFHAAKVAVLEDGRRCLKVLPGRRRYGSVRDPAVEPGDSSTPVFDSDGVLHGMVLAKHRVFETAYVVLMSNIIQACTKLEWWLPVSCS